MMADENAAKRICQPPSSPSLPSAVLHAILEAIQNGKDIAAFLAALPPSTLPPELAALRDLSAVVNLAEHWPVVHVTKIPIQNARLAINALPAFKGVFIDPGFTALAWLDAKLPRTMPVTLVVDPTVSGVLSTFAYVWGDRITNGIVKKHEQQPDVIPDILSRCVNVESLTIEGSQTQVAAAAYLAAVPTNWLHTLDVRTTAVGALDVTAIVAWLQGPSATSLSLACSSVSDPAALASAVQACPTLSALRLDGVLDVQAALATATDALHNVTSLALSQSSGAYGIPILEKLDRAKVRSIALESSNSTTLLGDLSVLATCSSLESLSLARWSLSQVSMIGVCPRLATAKLSLLKCEAGSIPTIMQWLSTSRCLVNVDFYCTMLGKDGVVELARVLPAWMAHGLETLTLCSTGLIDNDAMILAVALATGRNRRPLTIDLSSNQLTMVSAPLLLTTLGACYDTTLVLGSDFAPVQDSYLARKRRLSDDRNVQDLVSLHKLHFAASGNHFTSPSRTSSPWKGL